MMAFYTCDSYGDYGLWEISKNDGDTVVIKSRGVSRSNIIHYNPNLNGAHNHIFGCYQSCPSKGAPVVLYKRNGGFLAGDANGDGVVDVADITAIAGYILTAGEEEEMITLRNADVNGDGKIDVATLQIILNVVTGMR